MFDEVIARIPDGTDVRTFGKANHTQGTFRVVSITDKAIRFTTKSTGKERRIGRAEFDKVVKYLDEAGDHVVAKELTDMTFNSAYIRAIRQHLRETEA